MPNSARRCISCVRICTSTGLPCGPDHRRVQRLVEVELGHRDVVLEPALHRLPQRVDRAERAVAVLHRVDDDAHADEVLDLVELLAPHDHLLVDRPVVLRAAAAPRRRCAARRAGARSSASTVCEELLALGRLRGAPSARSRRSASGAAPRTRGPRAATSRRRCRAGARAARRCRASPARCAAASPRAATRSCACCGAGRRA